LGALARPRPGRSLLVARAGALRLLIAVGRLAAAGYFAAGPVGA
jgi:hypothetical protein